MLYFCKLHEAYYRHVIKPFSPPYILEQSNEYSLQTSAWFHGNHLSFHVSKEGMNVCLLKLPSVPKSVEQKKKRLFFLKVLALTLSLNLRCSLIFKSLI